MTNRLPDGSLCTFFTEPGARERGHWIYEDPFSAALRAALLAGAEEAGVPVRDGGCYGHVDGPRFNTRAEIRGLAACGVTAVSQTAGPETVLCGEAELPYALLGFLTDYANGVPDEPTPVETLIEMMAASTDDVRRGPARRAPARRPPPTPAPPGIVYRFDVELARSRIGRLGLAGDAEVVVAERLAARAADAHAARRRSARWRGPASASSRSVAGPGSPPSSSSSSSPRMIVVKPSSPWSASSPTSRTRCVPRRASDGIRIV